MPHRASLLVPAPPLELPTATGERRSLANFRGRPVMVSFLGPAQCLFCRAHVIRVIQARDEIARLGADVLFVAYHDPELMTTRMLHDLALPYILLLDRTREAYARWGLDRAGLRARLSPGLYWATLSMTFRVLLRRERVLERVPGERQLGGDFVVDRTGTLVFVNRMKSLHDRAKIGDLLAALRGVVPR